MKASRLYRALGGCALALGCGTSNGGDAATRADASADDGATWDGASGDAGALAPMIQSALPCGTPASAGGLREGADLQRHTIDPARFPQARCNDGTPAVMYYRPYQGAANRDRWVVQLQGGGSCASGAECAERWCSYMMAFGMTQMTSSLAPTRGIPADGILNRARVENPMRDWNHVFLRYCSSDMWSGTHDDAVVDAVVPGTATPARFRLHFAGARIFDAAITTLRQDGAQALAYTLAGGSVAMPDLDDAAVVILAGASGGAAGVIRNVDRLATALRANNAACASGGACPLRVSALIDSILAPDREALDWSQSPACTRDHLCDYASFFRAQYASGEQPLVGVRNDDTCEAWHRSNRPGEEWRCLDPTYALLNHVTTPMFVRMGQTDQLIGRMLFEAMLRVPGRSALTAADFAAGVRQQLQRVRDAQTLANERALIRAAPGTFGPSCSKHETLSDDDSTYNVSIDEGGAPVPFLRVLTNWFTGTGVTNLVTQPGGHDSCTP